MARLPPNKNFLHMHNNLVVNNNDNSDNTFLDFMILRSYKLDVEPCKSRANRYVILSLKIIIINFLYYLVIVPIMHVALKVLVRQPG